MRISAWVIIPRHPMKIITPATLHWSDAGQPFASDFSDCYFSAPLSAGANGLAETQHVFIAGNRLPERWVQSGSQADQANFVIGETGFGTGLNFIATWQLWNNSAHRQSRLYFISAELFPLRREDMARAASLWPTLKPFYDQLLEQYPNLTPGFHTLHFDNVTLLLLLGDATAMFDALRVTDHPDFYPHISGKVDAWFLDGFAPAKNPALWTDALINTLALLSKPQATLATFSAAGNMRRSLEAAGFVVQKQPGFGNKREMVTASFQPDKKIPTPQQTLSMRDKPTFVSSPYAAPWYIDRSSTHSQPGDKQCDIAIIGAGIAGCTLANALARRGYKGSVFDEQAGPARAASGNPQAILYSKFSASDDEFAQFNLATYLYALRFYRQLVKAQPTLPIHLCGVLQLAWCKEEQVLQNSLQDFFCHYPDLAQILTREQASVVAGVAVESGGVFFPQAGWINPAAVCEHLLIHPNITTIFNQRISAIDYEHKVWQLHHETQMLHQCAQLVIASGHQCQQFEQSRHLPLKFIRGQVTQVRPTAFSKQLKTVLCGEGYIAPAENNRQSFGATYTPKISDFGTTDRDHAINLAHLALSSRLLSEEWDINQGIVGGRVHLRTVTPDYFPVCGPLPNPEDFLNRYAPLRKNARANIPQAGSYYPNLYVFAGMGSRGMSYAPLCAEVLANMICAAPPLLPRKVIQQLNPARFIIRDLIKNRV
jgi:tRNA 5-methylaminomethyl-2-thiouridine biosynthesis bifunctional protein